MLPLPPALFSARSNDSRGPVVVVGILGCSIWVFTSKPFNLGLDLKGGVSVVLQAQETEDRPVTNEDVIGIMDVIPKE